jgi:histidinol dehydrogenase
MSAAGSDLDFGALRVLDLRVDPNTRAPRDPSAHASWREACARTIGRGGSAEVDARKIVDDVATRGDEALFEATQRLEGRALDASTIEIPRERWLAALEAQPAHVREALEHAAARITAFHRSQVTGSTGITSEGERLQSRCQPLERVAIYAPGGTAAYPSSVLMAGIPAKVAGVDERILITPRPSDVVLAAAAVADVTRVLAIGGAQGIAAVAFGTATVPRVDKIVGPGNAWVTAAKRLVYGTVDIDGIAGPSEILVVADASADPALIAADLLSQAEHDELASAVWVTDHAPLIPQVDAALRGQLATLPRRDIAIRSLRAHGAAVLCDSRAAMLAEADAYAPEHLELLVDDAEEAATRIRRAGAIFVGAWTPEAAGDYTAGPSHVLPTAGAARFASPLGVWDFVRWSSVIRLDRDALARQAPTILTLARAEGLEAHARAVELRLGSRGGDPETQALTHDDGRVKS